MSRVIDCCRRWVVGCAQALVACGGGAQAADLVVNEPGHPGAGAHGLAFHRYNKDSPTTISTPALDTQPSGSTLIVSVGRGNRYVFSPPTDNRGNAPYQQLGSVQRYTRWPDSGTAAYAFPSAVGGSGHVVSAFTPANDEITLAAVEVIAATHVQQFVWTEALHAPLTSPAVTTTGPATLVAFWWGDGGVRDDKTAVPNNGFVVIDSILAAGELVQCAVAVRNVSEAGTYDVTWTASPTQGAQLWLVAVQ